VDCRAISAWKTITTSPLMAVKVTQFFFLSLFIIFHVHHPSGPTTTQNFTKERNLIETKQTAVSFERENVSTRRRKQKKKLRVKVKIFKFWESQ
jgi:uncharacterized membrane protein